MKTCVKCDGCGKLIKGRKNKVYDEQFNIIPGSYHCTTCAYGNTEVNAEFEEPAKILNKKLCVHWINITAQGIGKLAPVRCGKAAKKVDTHGRELCEHHYNKWLTKLSAKTKIK